MKPRQHQPPDEEQISEWLSGFAPRPSDRFYNRMRSAPWASSRISEPRGSVFERLRNLLNGRPNRGWGPILAAAMAILVLAASLAAFPAVRATAHKLLSFFLPAASDRIAVPVTLPPPGSANRLSDQAYFDLTPGQAEEQAGFVTLRLPAETANLSLDGAHYDPDLAAITLRYTHAGNRLMITQRKLGEIAEYSSIGASAPVEIVSVRGVDGEFVAGGWRVASSDERAIATGTPGGQIDVDVYWDPTLSQHTLRWQEGEFAFEILSSGTEALEKADLIRLATSLK